MNIFFHFCTTQKSPWRAWTDEEKKSFLHLHGIFGRDFGAYVPYFQGRSKEQIKSFFYSHQRRRPQPKAVKRTREVQKLQDVVGEKYTMPALEKTEEQYSKDELWIDTDFC